MDCTKLSPRLALVAQMVREGVRLTDVGTDHAYLPVFLLHTGKIVSAIAADVRVGPLENAKMTIDENNFSHLVQTRLSDGLEKISADETDDIVFAGMGGELIVKLMENCPWVKNGEKHFVFQPMTHSEKLRSYLVENGFAINNEKAVKDSGKIYVVFDAFYDGKVRQKSDVYYYVGELDLTLEESKEFIKQTIRHLKNKLKAGENKHLETCIEEMEKMI